MTLCPVCNKDFQNLKTHLTRQSKNDEEHKKYLEQIESSKTIALNDFKEYKIGQEIIFRNQKYLVIEDLGIKLVLRRKDSNLFKFTIKKEKIS